MVSFFVLKPFLAIREIAAAESKKQKHMLQYAAYRGCKITCMLSSLICFTCYWRARQMFRIGVDWLLQAARSCGRESFFLDAKRKELERFARPRRGA